MEFWELFNEKNIGVFSLLHAINKIDAIFGLIVVSSQ
jgi:hypothetical protein